MSDDFNKLSVAGRIDAFDKRNGGNSVLHNEWILYGNGALRESWPLGALIDPPTDEYLRLTNILRYHQARHASAVRDFDLCKEQLMMSGYPDGESVDRLKQLQAVVGERNQAVTDTQAKLAATERGKQLERNRQMDAEYQQMQTAFKNQVREIRV